MAGSKKVLRPAVNRKNGGSSPSLPATPRDTSRSRKTKLIRHLRDELAKLWVAYNENIGKLMAEKLALQTELAEAKKHLNPPKARR